MSDLENQMGLFEAGGAAPQKASVLQQRPIPAPDPAPKPHPPPEPKSAPKAPPNPTAKSRAKLPAKGTGRRNMPPAKGISGLVPEGDVRLTANIRQDLHLKLKIASAYRRTTIGEIIEELIEKYV